MDLGTMIVSYRADTNNLVSGASQAKSSISDIGNAAEESSGGFLSAFSNMGSSAMSLVQSVSSTIFSVQNLAQTAIGLASAFLQPAETAETTTLSFTTLLHSTKAANQEMQDLNTYASGTPMQTSWVDGAAEKILAFGGQVSDVKPEISAIGDSLSGLGKLSDASLNSIVDVFGKVSAAGKLTGGDMMQLSNWGIPAWKALSESMHLPIPELQKMVSKGLIPASKALPALEQGMEKTFGGGMQKQANTFSGLLSTLQSNWQIMLATIGTPVLKDLEPLLSQIGTDLASPAFQQFATGAGQAIVTVFSSVGGIIASSVVPAFHALQPVAQQFISYFQSDQFAGIVADFQTVGNQIRRIAGDFQQAAGPANTLVGGALSSLPGILEGIFQAADNVIFPLGQFLIWMQQTGPWQDVIKDGLIGIGVAFAAIQIGSFIATIPALVTGFAVWAAGAWTAAAGTIAATWPILAIGAIIAIVVGGIILAVQHWAQISQWFGGIWKAVSGGIGGAFSAIGTKAHAATNGIGSAFSNLGTSIHDKGKDIQQTMQKMGQGAVDAGKWMYAHNTYWKAAVDDITAGVTAAKNWIVDAWNAITHAVVVAWKWLSDQASADWHAITQPILAGITIAVNWITSKWTAIHAWITDKWNALKGIAQGAWNGVVGVFEGIWNRISSPLTTASNNTKNWFTSLATDAEQWGANIIQGIINGIGSMFSALGSAASNAAGQVAKFLGFHSPAKAGPGAELNVWGPNLVKGFASGIDNSVPILTASVNHLMSVGTHHIAHHHIAHHHVAHHHVAHHHVAHHHVAHHHVAHHQMQYPIAPGSTRASTHQAGSSGSSSGGTNLTVILDIDGQQLAQVIQKHVEQYVLLKLGARGRAL